MSCETLLAAAFLDLADTLTDDFDVLDLLQRLASHSVELLDVDAAGVILADQRGRLQPVASTSHAARVLGTFAVGAAEGPCQDAYRRGEAVVNVSPADQRARWPRYTEAARSAGYCSSHVLPLRLRHQVIGSLTLFCTGQVLLSDEEVAIALALAGVTTIGLFQERTARQKEILAEKLQLALNSRVMLEQAKGVVAERAGVPVDEAFELISEHSGRLHKPLSRVVSDLLSGRLDAADLRLG